MAYSATFKETAIIADITTATSNTITNTGRQGFEETVLAAASDFEIAFELDVSQIKAFYLCATQDMTVSTNAADRGHDDQIVLLEDIPYIWYTGKYDAFKIANDIITNVFVDNDAGVDGVLRCEAIIDATA